MKTPTLHTSVLLLGLAVGATGCEDAVGIDAPSPNVLEGRLEIEADGPHLGTTAPDALLQASLLIRNTGNGPSTLESIRLRTGRAGAWQLVPEPTAADQIAPGEARTFQIEYRSCPEWWTSPETREVCDCPSVDDSVIVDVRAADQEPQNVTLFASSVSTPARLEVSPAAQLDLVVGRTSSVAIRNQGCEPLVLERVEITGPAGGPHGAMDDVRISDCGVLPCPRQDRICRDASSFCPDETVLGLTYDNQDPIGEEVAELRLYSNDPHSPRIVLLTAEGGETCEPPRARIVVGPDQACAGEDLEFRVEIDAPDEIRSQVRIQWNWLFAPPGTSGFVPSDRAPDVTTRPARGGLHIIGVRIEHPCGVPIELQRSISVSDPC